jgi:succinate dehydrogenase / fumarate reductase membrane anchor subunit
MDISPYGPKSGENAWLWLAKALSGLVIIVILIIHFIANHFAAPNGLLSYADIVRYYQNPLIPVMEIVFVAFAVSHALIGLRGIILDLKPGPAFMRVINWLFTLVGAGTIIYGIWLILTIAGRGAA